ncbi:TerB family tellurite resistance protein [Hoeflea sp.]|uniref:TerB family tellurite resistance protein n=1 Tax=Hoeflea sp. TaxID=1940281 RepID=UPI003BAEDBB5
MSMRLRDYFDHLFSSEVRWSGAVAEIADEPVALAEVLLLFRIVLADGVVHPSQLSAFERVCQRQFGVKPEEMDQLHALLDSRQGELSEPEAFALIRSLDSAERRGLLGNMVRIANANAELAASEEKLLLRMAELFGLEPGDFDIQAEKEDAMADGAEKTPSLTGWVRDLLGRHSSINQVAHDPALTAELLLLVRMSFADKSVNPAEADAFAAICTKMLGLDADELGKILHYINDFGYETTNQQAAAMLAGLSEARKREILNHLAIVAKADGAIDDRERRLLEATAQRLGFAL